MEEDTVNKSVQCREIQRMMLSSQESQINNVVVGERDWAAMVNKGFRKIHTEKVAFEWRPVRGERVSQGSIYGKSVVCTE